MPAAPARSDRFPVTVVPFSATLPPLMVTARTVADTPVSTVTTVPPLRGTVIVVWPAPAPARVRFLVTVSGPS